MLSANEPNLSHLDEQGQARMVDVSAKPATVRTAQASARVTAGAEVIEALWAGNLPKGEALATARIAGISAAKKTADLIPLCHPLPLEWVEVIFQRDGDDAIVVQATVKTMGRTGVEMEALTAASVAALTLYDMGKGVDKSIEIGPIRLERKSGGKSGPYARS